MTLMTVLPRPLGEWTVDDLVELPDDGLQYELLDGILLVSPAPVPAHQDFVAGVYRALYAACLHDMFKVYFAPLDWQPDRRTSLQPDLLVIARDQVGAKNITAPLALAVEVLSPSTRRKDLLLKRSKYEDAGVESYWVIDPDGPSVTVFELNDGRYRELGTAADTEQLTVERPFPVTIVPAQLR